MTDTEARTAQRAAFQGDTQARARELAQWIRAGKPSKIVCRCLGLGVLRTDMCLGQAEGDHSPDRCLNHSGPERPCDCHSLGFRPMREAVLLTALAGDEASVMVTGAALPLSVENLREWLMALASWGPPEGAPDLLARAALAAGQAAFNLDMQRRVLFANRVVKPGRWYDSLQAGWAVVRARAKHLNAAAEEEAWDHAHQRYWHPAVTAPAWLPLPTGILARYGLGTNHAMLRIREEEIMEAMGFAGEDVVRQAIRDEFVSWALP